MQGVTDYAIFMLDPEGRITNWNPAPSASRATRPRRSSASISAVSIRPRIRRRRARAGRSRPARERANSKGGLARAQGRNALLGERRIDAIHDDDGKLIGFAKITRDMTEKRETQLRLEESREQLFRSQKMEALGQLTGGLAHDFNNLLTAILGAADLALRNIGDTARSCSGCSTASATRRSAAASLTKQLLAFARAQPLEIQPGRPAGTSSATSRTLAAAVAALATSS